MLPFFTHFPDFESSFLAPLANWRSIKSEAIPLTRMDKWSLSTDGVLEGTHFLIEGKRTSFAPEPNQTEPKPWDQPIYRQGSGTLLLAVDEEGYLLIKSIFEPGNTARGYERKGLLLCTTTKFSPANYAQQKAQGRIPAFSDLLNEPEVTIIANCPAPGDGARADKQNPHYLLQTSRTTLEEKYQALTEAEQRLFALVHRDVFLESYKRGLVGEHLRDLSSLLLFAK
jgi:hypothetical protein